MNGKSGAYQLAQLQSGIGCQISLQSGTCEVWKGVLQLSSWYLTIEISKIRCIVSNFSLQTPQGFWSSHVWESSKAHNGPGAFKDKLPDGTHDEERPLDLFTALAVDILDEPSPKEAYGYRSLKTVKGYDYNPFEHPRDVKILIVTPYKHGGYVNSKLPIQI